MSKHVLFQREDYWAIWIGAFILFASLIGYYLNFQGEDAKAVQVWNKRAEAPKFNNAPFKSIQWHQDFRKLKNIKASNSPLGKSLKKLTAKPGTWETNPLRAFVISDQYAKNKTNQAENKITAIEEEVASKFDAAKSLENDASVSSFTNLEKNTKAKQAIDAWLQSQAVLDKQIKKGKIKSYNKLLPMFLLFVFLALLFGFAQNVMGESFLQFVKGFAFVFFIAIIAFALGAQSNMKAIGFGYAAWAIIIGLLISNTIGTPDWAKPSLKTAFFIKTALVLLGAEILLSKILAIGLPGIFVAWIVTPIVLITTYWFGQKVLKISSKTLNMTISADMSVCGVSAAVATAAACKATKEELTIAIGLSMVFTSIMMIVMPLFINWVGMPEILGGAWLGGTIDATGAVVAAGAFLGDDALNVAATIKMIQNVLIGLVAFCVAVYFSTRVNKEQPTELSFGKEIWNRFPKFILGFIGASILFSLVYIGLGKHMGYSLIDQGVIGGFTKNIRGWLFCIAFVSIGLSINFKDLKGHFTGGKPLILYMCGQAFNLILTLSVAYLMFYKIFPNITNSI
ncbi:MAG: putative sulfate exporter family transporter [Bacteroidota bacterium]